MVAACLQKRVQNPAYSGCMHLFLLIAQPRLSVLFFFREMEMLLLRPGCGVFILFIWFVIDIERVKVYYGEVCNSE